MTMAKKTYGHSIGKDGKPVVTEIKKMTKAQAKSLTEIPFTPGPKTRAQKIARKLWG